MLMRLAFVCSMAPLLAAALAAAQVPQKPQPPARRLLAVQPRSRELQRAI